MRRLLGVLTPASSQAELAGLLLARGSRCFVVVAALPRLPLLLPLLEESDEQDFEPVNRALTDIKH